MKKPLFIFELANNHNGSVKRAFEIISIIKAQIEGFEAFFDFAIKLQYRDIETFIHQDYKNSQEFDSVKRYTETKISQDDYKKIKAEIDRQGFISICTAFDEISAKRIGEQKFDYIKIASCSFFDWFLLEKIATLNLPIIASVAGASFNQIDKVVEYFQSKNKELSLLHCVAEYPTENNNLQLNQIDILKSRYPYLNIGYSTHESSQNFDNIKIAIAKGATIFEKHIGLDDYEGSINGYSLSARNINLWLKAAKEAIDMCGIKNERYEPSQKEINSLKNLSRGVYLKREIKNGEIIDKNDVLLAIPALKNQLLAKDFCFDKKIRIQNDIKENQALFFSDIEYL